VITTKLLAADEIEKCEPHPYYPGFVRATPYDDAGRRAMWIKFDPATTTLEIRAGREGGDCYVSLAAGQTLDARTVLELLDALERVRNDCGGDAGMSPWEEQEAAEILGDCRFARTRLLALLRERMRSAP
jgi:hypothetical protein